jgi:hypothetical protein
MTIPNDPESEGIPDVADDESTAYDDREHHRFDAGPRRYGIRKPS